MNLILCSGDNIKKYGVSAVIPTIKTRKKLLERALLSIKKQTYKDIETVVVDEGLPATTQRNIGIERSKNNFIAFLDDDDEWIENKIELQMEVMKKHPDCPIVTCYADDRRRHDGRVSKPPLVNTHKMLVKGFNMSSTSSYLCRKYALDLLKEQDGFYFDETLPSGHEYDLALRMSKYHDIRCVPEILMIQHKSPGQISGAWGKKIRGQYAMMHKWGFEYNIVEWLKRIGLIGLFFMGFFIGDMIMYPINFMKELHENNRVHR